MKQSNYLNLDWEVIQVDVSVIKNDQGKEELFRMLDRGIDDMEEGRELPLEEALNAVDRLVERRKRARA